MRTLAIALLLTVTTLTSAQKQPAPDTIFLNGDIYTGESPTARVQALAVRDGRILATGTNEQIRKLKGNDTAVVDLGGRFTMAGFNDAHLHLAGGGMEKVNVNLVGTKSLAEMQARIAERAKGTGAGEWIIGRGWDHTKWVADQDEAKLPSRSDLDKATGDHPAIMTRVDGHIAVVNSAALKLAGITAATKDPEGGAYDRDAKGEPTGILRESAKDLFIEKFVPKPSLSQRRRGIELALREAAEHGITSVQDNSHWEDYLVYEELLREGKLTLRICEWLDFNDDVRTLEQHRAHRPQSDPMLRTGLLKAYTDGSLGSRTAYMLQPYHDDPKNTGLPQFAPDKLNELVRERTPGAFQYGFHAIGDAGTELALDAFEESIRFARQQSVKPALGDGFRHRVEHAQVVAPEHIARFKTLGVIASMQPNHLLTDMYWAQERIGASRAPYSYAWRAFADAGVPLAFGTDYPVEPITPFRGLYAAVTRKSEDGTRKYPGEAIDIHQAIAAYTSGAAYAEFSEKEKGKLTPGLFADLVVLDRDITKVAPSEILGTRVLRTVVGGKTVFEPR